MKTRINQILAGSFALMAASAPLAAQTIVYDNLGNNPASAVYGADSGSPIFGNPLDLTSGGILDGIDFTMYNPGSGSIKTGTEQIKIYNNTTPYSGTGLVSAQDSLIATINFTVNFGSVGLTANEYDVLDGNVSSLDIDVPADIFITQQFAQATGTARNNGVVIFGDPTTGSDPSPDSIYYSATGVTPGFISGYSPLGYTVTATVVPDGGVSAFMLSMSLLGIGAVKRRFKTA